MRTLNGNLPSSFSYRKNKYVSFAGRSENDHPVPSSTLRSASTTPKQTFHRFNSSKNLNLSEVRHESSNQTSAYGDDSIHSLSTSNTGNDSSSNSLILREVNNIEDRLKDGIAAERDLQQRRNEALLDRVKKLEEELKEIKNKPVKRTAKGKLPSGLSRKVRTAYKAHSDETYWDYSKRFDDVHNEQLNLLIEAAVKDCTDHEDTLIRRSVRRYFEHLKRQSKLIESGEEDLMRQIRRRNSRRSRLFIARDKVGKEGRDLEMWKHVEPWMMSDVESDDEGKVFHRSPVWRTPELSALIEAIDEALGEIRCHAENSSRAPKQFVAGLILQDEQM